MSVMEVEGVLVVLKFGPAKFSKRILVAIKSCKKYLQIQFVDTNNKLNPLFVRYLAVCCICI